jgi:molecular chaperone GrpE
MSKKDPDELVNEIEGDDVEMVREAFEEHNREVSHKELDAMHEELEKAREDVLRAHAEVENIRRRSEKDVINARKFAVEKFAAEVLLVRDSLDSASQVDLDSESREIIEKMSEGLALTLKQLDNAMHKFDIVEIAPEHGEKMDPEKHQAMGLVEADGVEPNHIANVIQKGYTIKGRLLRPAMVMVAK